MEQWNLKKEAIVLTKDSFKSLEKCKEKTSEVLSRKHKLYEQVNLFNKAREIILE